MVNYLYIVLHEVIVSKWYSGFTRYHHVRVSSCLPFCVVIVSVSLDPEWSLTWWHKTRSVCRVMH